MQQLKEFYTISEAAKVLKCTAPNVYAAIAKGSLTAVKKKTYIKNSKGAFVETGKKPEKYVTGASIEKRLNPGEKSRRVFKQIKAERIDGSIFENGESVIVYNNETEAAEKLKIGKFALRWRLENGQKVGDNIRVSVVSVK